MNPSPSAYPLAWPPGWKRTPSSRRTQGMFGQKGEPREPGGFRRIQDVTIAGAVERLVAELKRMGIPDYNVIVSSNLLLRNDGLPRSGQPQPADPGACVYWKDGEQRRCMAIDRYTRVEQNIAALAATIEAMRAIERHGGATILDRAFTGFTALPAPMVVTRSWRDVLGFVTGDYVDRHRIEEAYRRARGRAHPDMPGGSNDAFDEVVKAREAALRELEGSLQSAGGGR